MEVCSCKMVLHSPPLRLLVGHHRPHPLPELCLASLRGLIEDALELLMLLASKKSLVCMTSGDWMEVVVTCRKAETMKEPGKTIQRLAVRFGEGETIQQAYETFRRAHHLLVLKKTVFLKMTVPLKRGHD